MAGPQFATDEQIIEALCQPFSLSYSACKLDTALTRVRSLRDANKVEIVKQRVEVHKQTAREISFQLEVIEQYDTLKQYITKTYGDSHGKD